jgi:hypothetical protein
MLVRQCQRIELEVFGSYTEDYDLANKLHPYIGFTPNGFIVGYVRDGAPYLWLCGMKPEARGRGEFRQLLAGFIKHYCSGNNEGNGGCNIGNYLDYNRFWVKTYPKNFPVMAGVIERMLVVQKKPADVCLVKGPGYYYVVEV